MYADIAHRVPHDAQFNVMQVAVAVTVRCFEVLLLRRRPLRPTILCRGGPVYLYIVSINLSFTTSQSSSVARTNYRSTYLPYCLFIIPVIWIWFVAVHVYAVDRHSIYRLVQVRGQNTPQFLTQKSLRTVDEPEQHIECGENCNNSCRRFLYTVCKCDVHRESKKTCHHTFVHIFAKYWPILKILSLAHSVENLQ